MLAPRTARKPIVAGTDSESGGISPAGDSGRPARDNTYMPDWSFRYRFKLGAGMSIATDSSELFLTEPDAPQRVAIRSVTPAAGDPMYQFLLDRILCSGVLASLLVRMLRSKRFDG